MESDELKALREEIAALRRDVARLEGMLGLHQQLVPLPVMPAWAPTYQPIYPGGPWPAVSGFGAAISAGVGDPHNAALAPSPTPQG